MSEAISLTGMILKSVPSGEYDKRLVLLTKERGKITAFARGARRINSMLMGSTVPFCLGTFRLYEGRNAYTLVSAKIDHTFRELREDLESACYGMYFMELAEYYGRENLDASVMLNLMYVSLRALENPNLPNRLVRYVYEIKMMTINGEYPQNRITDSGLSEAASYMISYVVSSPLQKLFTFTVKNEVLEEVSRLQDGLRARILDRKMKSLEVLAQMKDS